MSLSIADQLHRLGFTASPALLVRPDENRAQPTVRYMLPWGIQPTCGFVVTAKAIDPLVNERKNPVEVELRRRLGSALAELERLKEANEAQAQIIRALAARLTSSGC
jgi:hypothetical protein